jgi:hypothetical protein
MNVLRSKISGLLLAGLLSTAPAIAGIRVVSDIDDTTKITDVGDPLAMVLNGLFSKKAFTGMQEFYSSLASSRGYSFDYVTGAVDLLRFRAKRFLRAGGFPEGELHTKENFGGVGVREHKTRVLRALFARYPDDLFILVGDDTQADFEVYDDLFRSFPDRVLSIYIRRVTNRQLPPSAYPFLTAFDLARTEFLMGRLETKEAAPVALAILAEKNDGRIIPRYSYCPADAFFGLDPQMKKWNDAIDARVRKICVTRKTDLR